jgi:uncharacterized protein (TIGR02588 family)
MKHFEKNWLEWCVFGAGSLLVLATVSYLVFQTVSSNGRPATVEVRLGPAEKRRDDFAVPVTVLNRGDAAAETVLIEVQLSLHEGGDERAELQIQLLPGGATREGWVMFSRHPAQERGLTARVISYETP